MATIEDRRLSCPRCGSGDETGTSPRAIATGSCFVCDDCGYRLDPWASMWFH